MARTASRLSYDNPEWLAGVIIKPDWLKLIEEWRARGNFGGLTIPFLLGGLCQWPDRRAQETSSGLERLRALVFSLRDDTPDGVITRLYHCNRLGELVVIAGYGTPTPRSKRFHFGGIVADDAPLEDLVSELWRRYGDAIQAGNFSHRGGGFHPFNNSDLQLIDAAAARPDEDE